MKWIIIVLIAVVLIAAAVITFSTEEPVDDSKLIEDSIKAYYKAKPAEEGMAPKSEAEVTVMEESISSDRAEVSVTLEWKEYDTAMVFDLVLEKQEGEWTVVSEKESLPA